jgi:hypothetical protein
MKIDRVGVSVTTSTNGASGEIALGDVTNASLLPSEKSNAIFEINYLTKKHQPKRICLRDTMQRTS